ncbi:MAG: protein kinase [Gemmatimonadaceae bacterium]|nr:protein kinase [Gemmatimonadaceae bacterium]
MVLELREKLQSLLGDDLTIERELGGGGMARVFLAHERELDRRIVIKVILPDVAGAVSAERFKREIQLAAKLQHPHIVPVINAVSAGDLLYYTMPYVDGESLAMRLSRAGAVPVGEAIHILRDSIRALAYAHRHGVVHRDIKPANILLSEDSALVADFGIAKALSDAGGADRGLTTVGLSVGTPAYMAPEQSVGDAVDQRADIYSLGAVAYEMLSGAHVFAGKTAQQVMAAHVMETPAPLQTKAPLVSAALANLVMRCLEKDPNSRPQSADDLLHELDAAVTPSSGTVSVASARGRSRPVAIAASILLALLLLGGGALAFTPKDKLATAMALMRRKPAQLHTNRVIVAPFTNDTGNPKLASLGSMAADWLAQGLSRAGGLEVVDARTAMVTGDVVDKTPWPFRSRDRGKAIAEETGSGILISGTIYQDGDSLRISAKMTDVLSGKVLLVLTPISGPAAAPTKILDALTKRAVANIVQARDPDRVFALGEYSEIPSVEAYDELLKGIEGYFRGDTSGYAHLEKAIAIDSSYPTPVVFLAFSRLYRGDFAIAKKLLARAETLRNVMAPADRAMTDHLEALMRADGSAALAAAQQFMAVTPGSQESPLLLASVALSISRPHTALAALEHVDPDRGLNLAGPFYWTYEAGAYIALGKFRQALDFSRAGVKRFPDERMANSYEESLAALGKWMS